MAGGVLVGLLGGGVVGGVVGGAAAEPSRSTGKAYEPVPSTIVEVTGDKANGFGIHRYDGSEQFPPTDSEARAECSELDSESARVRCRTQVRTWYRDLADMKRAINYAQSLGSE